MACRLPVKYKRNLQRFFVLHSDLSLRGAMTALCAFCSHGFWSKVAFITRLEFLYDHIDEVCTVLWWWCVIAWHAISAACPVEKMQKRGTASIHFACFGSCVQMIASSSCA